MCFSPWHILLEHTTYYYSLSWSFLNALDFLSHSSLIVNWLGLTCTFLSFQFLTVLFFSLYYEPAFSLLYFVPSGFLLKSGLTNLSAVTVAVTVKTTTTRCFVSQAMTKSLSMVSSATTTMMCLTPTPCLMVTTTTTGRLL